MPSSMHEALIQIFHHRPEFAVDLLADAIGVAVPEYEEVRLESCDLTDLTPTEYRADAVVVLTNESKVVLAIVVEVQLSRDRGKQWSWPVYLTTLRARMQCPTLLMVVCVDTVTATWCATPIPLGHLGWCCIRWCWDRRWSPWSPTWRWPPRIRRWLCCPRWRMAVARR